jgi:hypothetical protein
MRKKPNESQGLRTTIVQAPDLPEVQQGIINGMKDALTKLRGSTPQMSPMDQASDNRIRGLAHINRVDPRVIRNDIRRLDGIELNIKYRDIDDPRVVSELKDFVTRTPELDQ